MPAGSEFASVEVDGTSVPLPVCRSGVSSCPGPSTTCASSRCPARASSSASRCALPWGCPSARSRRRSCACTSRATSARRSVCSCGSTSTARRSRSSSPSPRAAPSARSCSGRSASPRWASPTKRRSFPSDPAPSPASACSRSTTSSRRSSQFIDIKGVARAQEFDKEIVALRGRHPLQHPLHHGPAPAARRGEDPLRTHRQHLRDHRGAHPAHADARAVPRSPRGAPAGARRGLFDQRGRGDRPRLEPAHRHPVLLRLLPRRVVGLEGEDLLHDPCPPERRRRGRGHH